MLSKAQFHTAFFCVVISQRNEFQRECASERNDIEKRHEHIENQSTKMMMKSSTVRKIHQHMQNECETQ